MAIHCNPGVSPAWYAVILWAQAVFCVVIFVSAYFFCEPVPFYKANAYYPFGSENSMYGPRYDPKDNPYDPRTAIPNTKGGTADYSCDGMAGAVNLEGCGFLSMAILASFAANAAAFETVRTVAVASAAFFGLAVLVHLHKAHEMTAHDTIAAVIIIVAAEATFVAAHLVVLFCAQDNCRRVGGGGAMPVHQLHHQQHVSEEVHVESDPLLQPRANTETSAAAQENA